MIDEPSQFAQISLAVGRWALWISLGLFFAISGPLSALTVYYSNLPFWALRLALAVVVALALGWLAFNAYGSWRWQARGLFGLIILATGVWWLLIPASHDRDWKPDVDVLPTATFEDDGKVVVHNIRNCHYRSRDDFDVAHYDKTFDLNQIRGVDFLVSYWGSERIAHTFLSFEFEGGHWLPISVEIRPEKGERFHPVPGLFKQYELIYVVGDERDLIGLRTHHRDEDTYLYPTNATPAQARELLVSMLERVNVIAERPAHYRTIGANCTTCLAAHVNTIVGDQIPFTRRLLLSGYSDSLAYELKLIGKNLPFSVLKKACHISPLAKTLELDSNFSATIRAVREN